MRHEVSVRAVRVTLSDAPQVSGTSRNLRERTIEPRVMELTTYPDGTHRVELSGPSVAADGTVGAAYFMIRVDVDADGVLAAAAPKWVHALVAEVER